MKLESVISASLLSFKKIINTERGKEQAGIFEIWFELRSIVLKFIKFAKLGATVSPIDLMYKVDILLANGY